MRMITGNDVGDFNVEAKNILGFVLIFYLIIAYISRIKS